MSARRPKTEKGPEPRVEEPRVKVVGMLTFDEAAREFGLSKKALREKVDAEVFASARIGDETYVLRNAPAAQAEIHRLHGLLTAAYDANAPALGLEDIGGRIATTLMELVSATQQIAATLGGLAASEAAEAPGAPPPPTGTYGEQVDAMAERAIAQIEGAEGDWGLFSQFLQPEWKPLPDVLFNHLQVASAVEIEEYDVTLAIPSRAVSVLRAVKAKFGSRAERQRQVEDFGDYQDVAGYAPSRPSRYDNMPITPLTPSAPFTEEQQRVMERRHLFGVLTPFGLHLASA